MKSIFKHEIHRKRGAPLGLFELIAIAVGGMVGGGIFTVLGISVSIIGVYTPIAISIGGLIAGLAAYSYVKLAQYYKEEGAAYAFVKRVFPQSHFAASLIGWWLAFGYISTLAIYSYTFSSYAISGTSFADDLWMRKGIAGGVISLFVLVNLWSVKGMGKIEDLMVYTKLVILTVISFVLIYQGNTSLPSLVQEHSGGFPFLGILIVSSVTFVAYEGFELVINAVNEMENPKRNISRAIYSSIALVIAIYVAIAAGALMSIPLSNIVKNKEFALAAGAGGTLGIWGTVLVIVGALLATSSAISGTVFGASRQVAVIAEDGYLPAFLAKRRGHIPQAAILFLSIFAFCLVLTGELRIMLAFGSVTFLLVSFLMGFANHRARKKTGSSMFVTLLASICLLICTGFIFYFEFMYHREESYFILSLYVALTFGAALYGKRRGAL